MDPQLPNKLIATKYCFLISSYQFLFLYFFFFFSLFLLLFYVIINSKKIFHFFIFFLYFFYEFFSFFHVPERSGMFRNVPCSWFYRRPNQTPRIKRVEHTTRRGQFMTNSSRMLDIVLNTVWKVWKYFSNKTILEGEMKDAKMKGFSSNYHDSFSYQVFMSLRMLCPHHAPSEYSDKKLPYLEN